MQFDQLKRRSFISLLGGAAAAWPLAARAQQAMPVEAEADPERTTICNCTDCQIMSGAPLRAVIITDPGTFVLLSGKATEYRKTADSGNVRVQAFCPHCGTAIYATSTGDEPKACNVRLGALRQRTELVPRRQIFVCSQQPWVNELNSIPKFDRMPH